MKTRIVLFASLLLILFQQSHAEPLGFVQRRTFAELRTSSSDSMQIVIMYGLPHLNARPMYWFDVPKKSGEAVDPEVWDSVSWKAVPYVGSVKVDIEANIVRISLRRKVVSPSGESTEDVFPVSEVAIEVISNETRI